MGQSFFTQNQQETLARLTQHLVFNRDVGGPGSPADHRWRGVENLITTSQGVVIFDYAGSIHKLTDNLLWEWGYE